MIIDILSCDIAQKIQNEENILNVSDEDLDELVKFIKKNRGNEEKQLRRKIRHLVAKTEGWNLAVDGGFMAGPSQASIGKEWPDERSVWPFGKVFQRFERLALYLNVEHEMPLEDIEKLATTYMTKETGR